MKRFACFVALMLGLGCLPRAFAHAVLVESSPKAGATVDESPLLVDLKFNSRIDAAHSRLYLAEPDGKVRTLTASANSSSDEFAAKVAKLAKGSYSLRWQVLASDGHITRGEIPFQVR